MPTPVEFDPFSSVFFDDPYPTYQRLRDEAPVYLNDKYGFVALSRYADVVAAHRDWETYSSTHGVDLITLASGEPPSEHVSIIMMDPPAHHHMRTLVNRVFTPRAMAELEPMVRSVIDFTSTLLVGRVEFDAVAELAGPFPVEVICSMLGIPAADRQPIRHQVDLMLHREPGAHGHNEEAMAAAVAFGGYLYELVVDKRANPSDDLLSRLCAVEPSGTAARGSGLDDVEITGFATLLAAAGSETVTKLVGNAVVLFARDPGRVAKDPRRPVTDPERRRGGASVPAPLAVPGSFLDPRQRTPRRDGPGRRPGTAAHRRRHKGRA